MSALAVPEGLEPLAVWDAGSIRDLTPEQHIEMCRWGNEFIPGFDRARSVGLYLFDSPFAVVSCFALNPDGHKYTDPETGSVAVEPPAVVPLAELPPAHLLRRP